MGVFEFIIMLVIISNVGKFVNGRRAPKEVRMALPPGGQEEIDRIRDTVHELSGRLHRIEEERDFYKDLLEAPRSPLGIQSSRSGAARKPTGDGSGSLG